MGWPSLRSQANEVYDQRSRGVFSWLSSHSELTSLTAFKRFHAARSLTAREAFSFLRGRGCSLYVRAAHPIPFRLLEAQGWSPLAALLWLPGGAGKLRLSGGDRRHGADSSVRKGPRRLCQGGLARVGADGASNAAEGLLGGSQGKPAFRGIPVLELGRTKVQSIRVLF